MSYDGKSPHISPLPESWRAAIQEAAAVIRRGGVILYPTDTIWGLGCDATNPEAVEKLFALKHRPDSKAMLLLVDHESKIPGLVKEVPSIAYDLLEASTAPLTLVYPGGRNVAKALIAPEGTIAIRVTHEPFSQALCRAIRTPLVSTSANLSGQPTPQIFAEIEDSLKKAVDYVIPIRQEEKCAPAPSEIIAVGLSGEIKILRSARTQ